MWPYVMWYPKVLADIQLFFPLLLGNYGRPNKLPNEQATTLSRQLGFVVCTRLRTLVHDHVPKVPRHLADAQQPAAWQVTGYFRAFR